MRIRRTILGALVLGLLATGAAADTSVKKGKPGSPCKSDKDCDQTDQRQSCIESKCKVNMPPPPT
jgi:hypothetical protein